MEGLDHFNSSNIVDIVKCVFHALAAIYALRNIGKKNSSTDVGITLVNQTKASTARTVDSTYSTPRAHLHMYLYLKHASLQYPINIDACIGAAELDIRQNFHFKKGISNKDYNDI